MLQKSPNYCVMQVSYILQTSTTMQYNTWNLNVKLGGPKRFEGSLKHDFIP